MTMTEQEFFGRVRVLVEKSLPSELRAFDLSGRNFVHELFQKGKIKQRSSAGDSEFADVRDVKNILEFVPLLCACHALSRGSSATQAVPCAGLSLEELVGHLRAYGVSQRAADALAMQCHEI